MVEPFSARKSRDCLAMASQAKLQWKMSTMRVRQITEIPPKHQNTPMFLINIEFRFLTKAL